MVAMKRESVSKPVAKRRELKIVSQLKKDFPGAIRNPDAVTKVDVVPTGSLYLDIATGIGGWPRSRITTLAGFESAGKTTAALKALAWLQKQGEVVAFIDMENSLDFDWARKLGIDTAEDAFIYVEVDTLEEAGTICVELVKSGEIAGIVFDSVAAASYAAQQKGKLGDANMGKQGKLMGDFLRMLKKPVRDNNVMMIFINQLRDSLDPYNPSPVMPGGRALKFYSSIICMLKAKVDSTAGKTPDFATVGAKLSKNKLAPPHRSAEYIIDFTGKISLLDEVVAIMGNKVYQDKLGIAARGMMLDVPREFVPDHIYLPYVNAGTQPIDEAYFHSFKGKPALREAYAQDLEFVEVVAKLIVEKLINTQDFIADNFNPEEVPIEDLTDEVLDPEFFTGAEEPLALVD